MENNHPSEMLTQDPAAEQSSVASYAASQPTSEMKAETRENTGAEMNTATTLLDYTASKNAALTLRAINHKLRQQIIKLLEENKRMNVTDIYVKLRLEQSVASQHLAILRRANIVKTVREGKFIHYALNNERIAAISKFVKEMTSDMPPVSKP